MFVFHASSYVTILSQVHRCSHFKSKLSGFMMGNCFFSLFLFNGYREWLFPKYATKFWCHSSMHHLIIFHYYLYYIYIYPNYQKPCHSRWDSRIQQKTTILCHFTTNMVAWFSKNIQVQSGRSWSGLFSCLALEGLEACRSISFPCSRAPLIVDPF